MSCPARFFFCFAHPFEHVIGDAVDKNPALDFRSRFKGPRAYQRLVEKIFIIRIWSLGSPDDGFLIPIKLAPDSQLMVPGKRDFRERVDPRAHIFGSFRVMRGGSDHLMRPVSCARLNLSVEFLR